MDAVTCLWAWLTGLSTDSIRTAGTILAVIVSIAAFLDGRLNRRRTGKVSKENQDIVRRQLQAEIDKLLHDAWILMGGDLGSDTITKFASRAELNRAKREYIERALVLNQNYAPTYRSLGLCCDGIKNVRAAEQAYRKAIEIDPEYAIAHSNLGILLTKDPARRGEAEQAFRKAIEIDPEYAVAHSNLGNLLDEDPARREEAEQA